MWRRYILGGRDTINRVFTASLQCADQATFSQLIIHGVPN